MMKNKSGAYGVRYLFVIWAQNIVRCVPDRVSVNKKEGKEKGKEKE